MAGMSGTRLSGDTSGSADNICVSALNKGSSGDPGAWSAVSHTMQDKAVSDIYIRDHRSDYLWNMMILA
jgi:hypothetical protein